MIRRIDPYKVHRQFSNILPELAKIAAYDLDRFETSRQDIFVDYKQVFDRLLDIFMLPSETQEEAIRVIEDYIASRQKPYGQWKSPDWLAFMLGQIIEEARKPKPEKPLSDDELPF